MKIGIVAAMELELAPFKENLSITKQRMFSKNNFYVCSYHNTELILVCSGQGKTNSAVFTQVLIQEFKVDAVINVGICGGISQKTDLLDICIGEKYLHYDIRKKQSLQKFPCQLYYLADEALLNQLLSLDVNVKKGIFGTGEGFVTDELAKQTLIEEYQIDCVDMESAAIAQTCFLNDVPFISLRVVSDKADSQAAETTDGYQQEAMKSIFELVQLYLDTYY